MEQYHLVNKVSRFFPSSFTSSCKSNTTSAPDVVESSISITKTNTRKTFPYNYAIQNPKKPFSNVAHKNSMIKPAKGPKTLHRNDIKVSRFHKKSLLLGSDADGRKCPPVTPVSSTKKAYSQKKEKVKSSSSNSGRWFSSTTTDDEEEEAGLLDGKSKSGANSFSFSSCSSESFRQKVLNINPSTSWSKRYDNKIFSDSGRCSSALSAHSVNHTVLSQCSQPEIKGEKIIMEDDVILMAGCKDLTELYYGGFQRQKKCRKHAVKSRRRRANKIRRRRKRETVVVVDDDDDDDDLLVEDSYAVEKSSSDPYGDFRTSMVEMIMEKQMFGAKDLRKLLDCFLSLNSSYYHNLIVEVFMEICDTLFEDFGGDGQDYSILFATDEEFANKDDAVAWVKGMGMANDSKTQNTGCKFKLYVHPVDGKWRIRVYPGEFGMHNHELFDEDHPTRGLSDGVKRLIQRHLNKELKIDAKIANGFTYGLWKDVVEANNLDEYNKVIAVINRRWQSFPRVLTYIQKTWLVVDYKFVKAWTNAVFHMGNTTTGRVESAHKQLKTWLETSTASLDTLWAKVHLEIQSQLTEIRAGTSAPTDVDDEVLYTGWLMEELNECPKAVRRTVNRVLHDIMHPEQCGFKQPEEVKRRKGRPKGAKSKKKTEANPVAHEQSPQKKATPNVWDYRDEAQGKSTTVTSDSSKKRPSSSGGRTDASTGTC
ncbi:OLC1v1028971C1 [Oldenlandia corymbosa var. corymbosa]|uniref:OLC1v1028971C1 n=1 Tax=Oldenlandia corymbosa var. corymbosa TaxID=529605 RepID=A0AAV1CCZ7_OLDCO|nr:OLC1v1028971C1 [Oldenlandia corymbosa var. corymbosa]